MRTMRTKLNNPFKEASIRESEIKNKTDMAATNKVNKEAKKDQIDVLKANRELLEKALKENQEAVIQVAENVNKIASEIGKSM